MRNRPLAALVPLAGATAALLSLAPAAGAATDCDAFAAPDGSDANPGTLAAPYASAEKLVASLAPGSTGCFRAGLYPFATLNVARAGLTLAPYGDEAATLRGDIKVLPGGAGTTIEGLRLNGAGGANEIGPRIYADRVVLRDNEITNQHTGICVHIGRYNAAPAPQDVLIERNRIHDCGELPATNHHHGIYLAEAHGTVIRDNWIYANADRGIQQYPDTQGSRITGNVIYSNGQGVNFGGDDSGTNCSNGNVVEGNVIADSRLRWNAYSGSQGRPCSDNLVRANCVHAAAGDFTVNGGIEPDSRSFSEAANLTAAPRFVAAGADDYRLQEDSPCLVRYTGTMSAPGAAAPPDTGAGRLTLKAGRKRVRAGRRIRLRGTAPAAAIGQVVRIERRRHGRWRGAGRGRVQGRGRFTERVRIPRDGGRVVKLRAQVSGEGHSRVVRVRVRG